jgi:hypothetical protein
MTKFICKSSDGRVLCYLPDVGRRRIYRRYIGEVNMGLKVLEYDTLEYCEKVCEDINERTGDEFFPYKIIITHDEKESRGSEIRA